MPFMGGMEATELIRLYEMQKSLSPTPIIALTAHASCVFTYSILVTSSSTNGFLLVIGDRERCLQAGMVSIFLPDSTTKDFVLMFSPFSGRPYY